MLLELLQGDVRQVVDVRVHVAAPLGDDLVAFRHHLVGAAGGVDLVAMFVCSGEKEIFGLAEERLLDPAILHRVKRGVAEEPVAHGGSEVFEQTRVAGIRQLEIRKKYNLILMTVLIRMLI